MRQPRLLYPAQNILYLLLFIVRLPYLIQIQHMASNFKNLFIKIKPLFSNPSSLFPNLNIQNYLFHIYIQLGEPLLSVLFLNSARYIQAGERNQRRRIHQANVRSKRVVHDSPCHLQKNWIVRAQIGHKLN